MKTIHRIVARILAVLFATLGTKEDWMPTPSSGNPNKRGRK